MKLCICNMKKQKRKKYIFFIIAISIFLGYIISKYFYQFMLIQGDSMYPAYHNMQLVLLNKYDRDYREGDVIAFHCDKLDCVLVKRIERINDDGTYYVLGDNIEKSVDSRDDRVGYVNKRNIIGKIVNWGDD